MWARRSLRSPFKEPQGSAQCRSVIRAHRRALIDLRSACWLVWLSVGKFRVTNSVHAVRTALDSAPSFRVRGGAGPGRDAQSHLGPSYIGPFPLQAADPSSAHYVGQVSILAEMLGMKVRFWDVVPKLPLGNAVAAASMDELLAHADYVLLHVPK